MKNYFLFILLALIAFGCSEDGEDEVTKTGIFFNQGIDELKFGDPGSAAIDAYGTYEYINALSGPDGVNFNMWFKNGLGIQLKKIDVGGLSLREIVDRSEELIDTKQGIVQIAATSPYKGTTPEGIGLGSTRDKVVTAYGEPDRIVDSNEYYDQLNAIFTYNRVKNTVNKINIDNR